MNILCRAAAHGFSIKWKLFPSWIKEDGKRDLRGIFDEIPAILWYAVASIFRSYSNEKAEPIRVPPGGLRVRNKKLFA